MRLYILLFILFLSTNLLGQSDSTDVHFKWYKNNLALTVAYINGSVAPTNVFVKGNNLNSVKIDKFQALNIKLSTQTLGTTGNEQVFNYPLWGLGCKVLDFNNINEIGIPVAVYGFVDWPVLIGSKYYINAEMGFGLSFNWHSFNPLTNKFNIALGLGQAFMSDAGITFNYELTERIDFLAGLNFTHFSNGAIKMPNYGINSYAPKIGLKYNFFKKPEFIKTKRYKYKSENEIIISAFAGIKNIIFDSVKTDLAEKYEGVFFPVYGVSALFNRQISRMSKIGAGFTLNVNDAINAQIKVDNNELVDVDAPFLNQIQLSIYPSYTFCVDKISIVLQPAFYIYRKTSKNQSPVFHQRISINYQITNNIFAGITLRDYSMHADFVEWSVGYRFYKQNNHNQK